jgi:hypothetical protein
MGTDHRGRRLGDNHKSTPRMAQLNANMQAREDSYGESGEYEAEAKYAAAYQDSQRPKYKMNPEEQQTAWEDEQYRKMEKDPSYESPKTTY